MLHDLDNCLVFLPRPAREALGLAGNLEEHADGEKELWFGRFFELRQLERRAGRASAPASPVAPASAARAAAAAARACLLYTSPSPRDGLLSRMPSSA